MVVAAAMVAFCVPAAFCLRPSSYLARHVPRATVTVQAGNFDTGRQRAEPAAPERSADVLATSVHTSRSLVSMLDTPVLDQLGSQLSMDTGMDTARSPLLERLEAMEGFWYSDDFYGPHGREWVQVSATLVGAGTSSLVAVKVKGDANVPSGKTTWRTTRGLPEVGGPSLPAEIQVRANAKDPNGFS